MPIAVINLGLKGENAVNLDNLQEQLMMLTQRFRALEWSYYL